jgi:6-phosphofructokinase 1
VKDEAGRLLSMRGVEAGRYVQLGGVGLALAQRLAQEFGVKYHVAVPDYLQRAAAHWASPIDYEVADRLDEFAVETALAGISAAMVAVERQGEAPYRYRCVTVPIDTPANRERGFPPQWIDASGCGVNEDFQRWLASLIEGTLPTPCRGGLPDVHLPAWESLPKRCAPWSAP